MTQSLPKKCAGGAGRTGVSSTSDLMSCLSGPGNWCQRLTVAVWWRFHMVRLKDVSVEMCWETIIEMGWLCNRTIPKQHWRLDTAKVQHNIDPANDWDGPSKWLWQILQVMRQTLQVVEKEYESDQSRLCKWLREIVLAIDSDPACDRDRPCKWLR